MTYYIDQSGKIEDTAKDTVLAYANGKPYAVFISKRHKRRIQELFRRCGLPRLFVYYLFAAGLFYLLKGLRTSSAIIIDTEYPGKDKIIAGLLTVLLEYYSKPTHDIRFSRVGNHPKVHYAAKNVFDRKTKPNEVLGLKTAVALLKKTDGRLRACFSTLVDARPRSVKLEYQKKIKKSRGRR
jgi:hypothetical protein